VVAPARPSGLVAGGQQRVDLRFGEVSEEVLLGPLGRDREDAPDGVGVLGVMERDVAEERVDGGQPVVARDGRVAALVLEVIEAAINGASRSPMSRRLGAVPVRCAAKLSSSRKASR
jgi:hypothetical protein